MGENGFGTLRLAQGLMRNALVTVQSYVGANFSVEKFAFVLTFAHRLKQIGFQQGFAAAEAPI